MRCTGTPCTQGLAEPGVLQPVGAQVPCASTLCVVNLGAAEARVEALAGEHLALRRRDGGASGAGGPAEGGRGDAFMFADDDDNYLVQVGGLLFILPSPTIDV